MSCRRNAVEGLLKDAGCDHLVYCGMNRFGSAVQWLSGWPVTAKAVAVFSPGGRDAIFVQYVNHAVLASIMAETADVAWGGPSSIHAAVDVLTKRKAKSGRVAFIGPLLVNQYHAVASNFGAPRDINKEYIRLRQVKPNEELDWFRIGAYFADLGMLALLGQGNRRCGRESPPTLNAGRIFPFIGRSSL